jgi:phosphoribosylformylglycinamidine cyclo-ligase
MAKVTYKDAGVDLDVYDEAMTRLPRLMHRTFSPRVLKLDGGFAGLFQLDFANRCLRATIEDPVLVSCTDGVGTKLKVAISCGRHDTVGIDLVAMSVNDALVLRGRAAVFPGLRRHVARRPAGSSSSSGRQRRLHPGRLRAAGGRNGDHARYVRSRRLRPGGLLRRRGRTEATDRRPVDRPGDIVVGVPPAACTPTATAWCERSSSIWRASACTTVCRSLAMRPSAKRCSRRRRSTPGRFASILQHYRQKSVIHGLAHITGGGLRDNLERILPEGTRAVLDRTSWKVPPVFHWLQGLGDIDDDEMERVFNMGIGMTLVFHPRHEANIRRMLSDCGFESSVLGEIQAGPRAVVWK